MARIKKAGGRRAFGIRRHQRGALDRGRGRGHEALRPADVLVSNAGIGIAVPTITEMSLEDWRRQTAINLDGVFLSVKPACRRCARPAAAPSSMMSSLAGLRGAAGLSGYCATKAASGCSPRRSRWSARRSATASASTRCIPASSTRRSGQDPDRSAQAPAERADRSGGAGENGDAAGRAGACRRIAQGVLYLASDASRYVTGRDSSSTAGWMRVAIRAETRSSSRHCGSEAKAIHASAFADAGLRPPSVAELSRKSVAFVDDGGGSYPPCLNRASTFSPP